MNKSDQLLIIGLDGATWDVLDPWIEDGSLPNLARLRNSGRWGTLQSTIPPITAAAWSTFMTGKRPGKHGVFHFINLFDENSTKPADRQLVDARSNKSGTVWDTLGHHNRKLVLINIPMTYPPRPINGVMITGLLTPANASVFTYPPELSDKITDYKIDLDRFIDKKPFLDDIEAGITVSNLALVDEFRDMLEKRAKVSFSLMESEAWDAFMVVFTGTDRMGHYLWPYHRTPEADDAPEVRQLCQAVREYYIRLDEIVGELVEKAGKRATTIIISDHGMGPPPPKQVHCNKWLADQGWLSARSSSGSYFNPDSWLKPLGIPRDKLGRLVYKLPGLSKSKLVKKAVNNRSITIDPEDSKVSLVPIFFNIMGIRIHLEGDAKDSLCQEIIERLQKIIDPETGQCVVQKVHRGSDYYHGPYVANIPDLIVQLDPEYGCSYHMGHYSSVVTKRQDASGPAKHRIEGIFIASGPDILPNPEPLSDIRIEDVAPTMLHLMKLPTPSDLDGRVLAEMLSSTALQSQPVEKEDPRELWPTANEAIFFDEVMSEKDEAQIRDRLQALGYFE